VCNHGHIKGQQGVALDDMVYVMTRMARQMEDVSQTAAFPPHFGVAAPAAGAACCGQIIACAVSASLSARAHVQATAV
jgi:hypothetical protein